MTEFRVIGGGAAAGAQPLQEFKTELSAVPGQPEKVRLVLDGKLTTTVEQAARVVELITAIRREPA
jgi:hypothetical protein